MKAIYERIVADALDELIRELGEDDPLPGQSMRSSAANRLDTILRRCGLAILPVPEPEKPGKDPWLGGFDHAIAAVRENVAHLEPVTAVTSFERGETIRSVDIDAVLDAIDEAEFDEG